MIWNNNTCGTIQDTHPRKPETPKPPEHPSPLPLRTSLRLAVEHGASRTKLWPSRSLLNVGGLSVSP